MKNEKEGLNLVYVIKNEIDELREILNEVAVDIDNANEMDNIIDISERLDELIVLYMKNIDEFKKAE